jgi:hypothetical protein
MKIGNERLRNNNKSLYQEHVKAFINDVYLELPPQELLSEFEECVVKTAKECAEVEGLILTLPPTRLGILSLI